MKKLRALIFSLISVFLLVGVVGCSSGDSSKEASGDGKDEKVEIRFTWWGDTKRHELYNAIVDRFEEKYPNIKVKREFGGWPEYWEKLTTQIAGGNAPDVVSMHQFYVADYARRNALLELSDYVKENTINQGEFPESVVNSGKVDDKLYMIAQGVTMPGLVYNKKLFDELGVEYPKQGWTYDDFTAKVKELKSKGIWGVQDFSGGQLQPNFRYFARSNGQDLFTKEGKLGFKKETLVKWWTMWDELRKAEAIPDAATGTEYESAPLEQNLFVTGKTAIHQIPANQLYLYQQQFPDGELAMVTMPTVDGGEQGEYIEGAYLSITQKSKHPKEAALFINFFVNEEKALELFKVEQGSPGSTKMADFVKPLLEPAQTKAVEFIQSAVKNASPAPYSPAGVTELEAAFKDSASAISFGKMSVEEAADKFMKQAESILK
ncbi:sugar ABC transporter substrate-binding protein [Neobacillus niacini]|uniref:ABC transporter substrate-binding protein n=1 Tax=Neobacillus niacini TaxID=86668 RepID=UPI00052FA7EA|nr:sugar ABC transporter substrate-binding protein [Neobacillus niacini]KGM45656.1 sugar-binding protein [Neobacillus niacini]MEC1525145.1 sugar ABC transporter substrate-binding protein [Neobacillus niacini]